MFVKWQLGMHGRPWLINELGEVLSVVVLDEQRWPRSWTYVLLFVHLSHNKALIEC